MRIIGHANQRNKKKSQRLPGSSNSIKNTKIACATDVVAKHLYPNDEE
jgi:hypothetical protein